MKYLMLCFFVLTGAYFLNILYITVFYHRGLTHGAIKMKPFLQKIVIHTGNWITGIDPKSWSCMHRMHHAFSDTPKDPHSPVYGGVIPLFKVQYDSYKATIRGLIRNKEAFTSYVTDLDFSVHWLNKTRYWSLPYVIHAVIGLSLGIFFNAWLLGASYYVGIMSHPIQGWMVNALSHKYGYRNFSTPDNSKNNTFVAWFVMGEGFQNNHHQSPQSAKFSVKWWEIDMGYGLCKILNLLGLIEILPLPEDKLPTLSPVPA